jgi:hypothetical protein
MQPSLVELHAATGAPHETFFSAVVMPAPKCLCNTQWPGHA